MPRTSSEEGPHPLDVAVGARVRLRRKEIGLSQDELARRVGITFQQIQKYEHGTNRISFSRLIEICEALNCSLADLIADIGTGHPPRSLVRQSTHLVKAGASDLLAAYANIPSPARRRAVLQLARQLAAEQQAEHRPQGRKGR
jgi:transcriptional regulator with XRE-family HTH domain